MSVNEDDQSYAVTTFIWTIENFEMCSEKTGESTESPEFIIFSRPMSSFILVLYAGGKHEENPDYISLYLKKSDTSHTERLVYSFTIGIITRNGKQICKKLETSFNHGRLYGAKKLIEREKIISSEKQLMLPDGNLTLFCEISECKVPLNLEDQIRLKEISDAFAKLYKSGEHSDATVEVKEGSFRIHKAIVEARFPDFLKNINGNVCKLENISVKTLESLLQYIYSGYLNVSEVNLFGLSASGYEIPKHLESLLLTSAREIKAVTCISKKDISFTWKIHNLKSLEPDKSLRFYYKGDPETWTWFTVILNVSTEKDNLIISIERYSKSCKKIICNIKIYRVNKTSIHTFEEDRWALPNIPLKDIFSEEDSISSSENDINLNFKISVSDQLEWDEIIVNELYSYESFAESNAEDLLSLRNDLQNLHNNPKFSDIVLKCVEDKYPAHTCILSARSTTFANMLQNEAALKDNEVVIDLIPKVAKDLIFYIYNDDIQFSSDDTNHVIDIYNAANEYNLPGLRRKCSEIIKQSLKADMAGEVLTAAYDCDDTELKDFIYNFVCSNPQDIAKSEKWDDTMKRRPDIAVGILHKTVSHLASK